ncbi:MAG TPA: hypothetical protein VIG33_03665 [Pseudobdellovibrionaceae bacterium]|jgi:hypothetical protein
MKFILIVSLLISANFSKADTGFTIGDFIVTKKHFHGMVVALYPDQTVDVKFTFHELDGWGDRVVNLPINRVSKIPSSIDGFNVNDNVCTSSHECGRIIALYPDHTVDIKVTYNEIDGWGDHVSNNSTKSILKK